MRMGEVLEFGFYTQKNPRKSLEPPVPKLRMGKVLEFGFSTPKKTPKFLEPRGFDAGLTA